MERNCSQSSYDTGHIPAYKNSDHFGKKTVAYSGNRGKVEVQALQISPGKFDPPKRYQTSFGNECKSSSVEVCNLKKCVELWRQEMLWEFKHCIFLQNIQHTLIVVLLKYHTN